MYSQSRKRHVRKTSALIGAVVLLFTLGTTACSSETLVQGKAGTTDVPADSITYIRSNGAYIPLSYISGGEQKLSGTWTPSATVYDSVLNDAPAGDTLSKVSLSKEFESLDSTHEWGPIASNGTWDFFPGNVSRVTHNMNNQPQQDTWTEYFRQKLDAVSIDSPVVITDVYSFSWDGVEASIVTASNLLSASGAEPTSEGYLGQTRLENSAPGIYTISTLFLSGSEPVDLLFNHISGLTGQKTAGGQDMSYTKSDITDGTDYPPLANVQYDNQGGTAAFQLYYGHGGELTLRNEVCQPDYLVADIDGDGKVELVFNRDTPSSTFSYTKVYKLADHELSEVMCIGG